MSGKLIGWAFEVDDLAPMEKLVLLALADNADRAGICWPSQEEIARKTGLSRRTVVTHLSTLKGRELVAKEPRLKLEGRGRSTDIYRLAGGDEQCADDGRPVRNGPRDQCANDGTPSNKGTPKNPQRTKNVVGRKAVSDSELTLAAAVVSSFNKAAGTRLSTEAHLTPVVGRIREHPELNGNHHRQVIEAVFAGNHWWDDPAGIQIVYGNAAIFEKSIELARAAAKKKSTPTFDVNAEMARVRKEQGL